jgi:acetyl-CoA synthetase
MPCDDFLAAAVPKAYITLAPGHAPEPDTALEIFEWSQSHSGPFKRVRRLVFAELPKTISGKIRRTDLRALE